MDLNTEPLSLIAWGVVLEGTADYLHYIEGNWNAAIANLKEWFDDLQTLLLVTWRNLWKYQIAPVIYYYSYDQIYANICGLEALGISMEAVWFKILWINYLLMFVYRLQV